MNELSSRGREVVRSGRDAFLPTGADRARMLEALRARLGDAALPASGGWTPAAGATWWLWPGLSSLAVGAIGALLLLTRTPVEPPPAPTPAPTRPLAASSTLPGPLDNPVAPRVAAPAPPEPQPAPSVAPTARRPSDHLAEEVALLSKATSALNAGRAGEALQSLDEHQRKFPNGALTEERRGARARALCALGLRSEGEKELVRLARIAPSSPHLLQARELCGSATEK